MQWDQLQKQWQQRNDCNAPTPAMQALLQSDQSLQARVRRRDRIESLAAVVVLVWFAIASVESGLEQAWLSSLAEAGIAVWAAWVPMRLRQARHAASELPADLPIRDRLQRLRDIALVQARMLQRAWLWYVLPPTACLTVLTLDERGPAPDALVYLALVYAFGGFVAWLNHRTALRQFHRHALDLQAMIAALADR